MRRVCRKQLTPLILEILLHIKTIGAQIITNMKIIIRKCQIDEYTLRLYNELVVYLRVMGQKVKNIVPLIISYIQMLMKIGLGNVNRGLSLINYIARLVLEAGSSLAFQTHLVIKNLIEQLQQFE